MIIFIAFVLQLGHKLIILHYEIKQNNVQNLKKKKEHIQYWKNTLNVVPIDSRNYIKQVIFVYTLGIIPYIEITLLDIVPKWQVLCLTKITIVILYHRLPTWADRDRVSIIFDKWAPCYWPWTIHGQLLNLNHTNDRPVVRICLGFCGRDVHT